mgnify:CR=1 FL=1
MTSHVAVRKMSRWPVLRYQLLKQELKQIFETLLDRKITLSKNNAVFLLNDKVINLAGVVGGKSTACSNDTKTVLIECAYFQPEAIIGKSVKYDIQSEASHKFERSVDPACHDMVIRRFINIVSSHANIKDMSTIHDIIDKIDDLARKIIKDDEIKKLKNCFFEMFNIQQFG